MHCCGRGADFRCLLHIFGFDGFSPEKPGYTTIRAIMSMSRPVFLKFSTGALHPDLQSGAKTDIGLHAARVPDEHNEKAREHGARGGGVYMYFPGFDGIRNIRSATTD